MVILLSWLLADFISGLGHWAQDKLLDNDSRLRFLKEIKSDNDLHHDEPEAMTHLTYWENISTTAPYTIAISLILFFVGAPMLVWLSLFFVSFANLVHRFSHEPEYSLSGTIRVLQKFGIFVSHDQHSGHHYVNGEKVSRENANEKYCVMTSWLNPILDKIGLFRFLDYLVLKMRR